MDTQYYRQFVEILKNARRELADVAERTNDKENASDLRRIPVDLDKAINAYSDKIDSPQS